MGLFNPVAAILTATALAGWFFILIGILQIVAVFRGAGWGAKILDAIMGSSSGCPGRTSRANRAPASCR